MALFRAAAYPAAMEKEERDKSLLFNAGIQVYNPDSLILDLVFMEKNAICKSVFKIVGMGRGID